MIFILLPAYNEGENIGPLLRTIEDEAKKREENDSLPIHAVVVNDGSDDDTRDKALSYSGPIRVTVIDHPQNAGLGAALKTGIGFILKNGCGRDSVITLDADGTHHPRYIFQLADKIDEGFDIAIASRYVPGGKEYGVGCFRRLLSHGARRTYHWFLPAIPINDFSCGFRAFSFPVVQAVVSHWKERLFETPGFACTGELMLKILAHTTPGKITEIPFELHYEAKKGKSKMPAVRTAVGTLALLLRARKWLNEQSE